MPAFLMPALRSTLGNFFVAILILFYFFLNDIFSYKTRALEVVTRMQVGSRVTRTNGQS